MSRVHSLLFFVKNDKFQIQVMSPGLTLTSGKYLITGIKTYLG
jgi:hypothetical protein